MDERLAKVISRLSGISRRAAERAIESGTVQVNQKTITTPVFFVSSTDIITLDNEVLQQVEQKLFIFHKPAGFVCSHTEQKSQKSIYSLLHGQTSEQLRSVGRLDINSEGLLLLTNSPSLAHSLQNKKWSKTYKVRIQGKHTEKSLARISKLKHIDGYPITPMSLSILRSTTSNTWVEFTLWEGRNRQIRKALEVINSQASRIIRTKFGPIELGELPRGALKTIKSPTS